MTTEYNKAVSVGENRVRTPSGVVCFPHLFTPSADLQGVLKYSVTLAIPKVSDMTAINELVDAVVYARWGKKVAIVHPVKDGNDLEFKGAENNLVISASNKFPREIVGGDLELIEDENLVYAGCIGRMVITAFPWDKMGRKGVSFGLENFQKMYDGERIQTSKVAAKDEFTPIQVAE